MPRKFGQHFLVRDSVLEQLARAACGDGAPRVVEIGPGRGALTRHLLAKTDELHVIEIDRRLVSYLEVKFKDQPHLLIHHGDVLRTNLAQWGAAVIAGNLPYYITSPIIERFISLPEEFRTAMFLMQWEVAQRLLAGPGTRDYGYLTVATRLFCEVELVCKVPPSAFAPPPKVDSGAVTLTRKALPENAAALLSFVGRCFRQKRKTLRNNLRPFHGSHVDSLPEAHLRAEQLSVEQLADLQRRLSEERHAPPR